MANIWDQFTGGLGTQNAPFGLAPGQTPQQAGMAMIGDMGARMLANVNTSARNPGERAPAFVYRVDYSRGEFQGFGFAGVHGKAANFADPAGKDSRLDLFEFDAYFIRGDWTVQGQLSYGQQQLGIGANKIGRAHV
mgnify:CR=1 FL=1